jgi:hypothetical protein
MKQTIQVQDTHLSNLIEAAKEKNAYNYWFSKMNLCCRMRVASILQTGADYISVLQAINVIIYAQTNSLPNETNELEYE